MFCLFYLIYIYNAMHKQDNMNDFLIIILLFCKKKLSLKKQYGN